MAPEFTEYPAPQIERASAQILDIAVTLEGGTTVLVARGEMDMDSAPLVVSSVERVASSAPDRVVLDLSGVTFLDSSGIKALVRAKRHLAAKGCQLRLRNPGEFVQRVFAIAKLDNVLDIDDGSALAG